MVPVAVAAEEVGYTRAWIHKLADDGVTASEFLTDNFRLVDVDALMEYAIEQRGETAPQSDPVSQSEPQLEPAP